MIERNKKMKNLGTTLSCLGGLILIFNMTTQKDNKWGMALAILAVVLALAGLYLIERAKKGEQKSNK